MNKDARRIKNRIQAGIAVVNACALVACGGTTSLPVQSSNGTLFKSVTLQSSKASSLTGSQAASRRRSADACVPATNLQVSGIDDVVESASGTLGNGDSINVSWSDYSTGYTNYITSPIAGGYNVADVQANLTTTTDVNGTIQTNQSVNIMQGVTITTYGNTVVSLSQTAPGTPLNYSIVNNGTTMEDTSVGGASITLAHGEVVSLTNPYPVTFGDGLTVNEQTFEEKVTDSSSGGEIDLQVVYVENYDAYPGDPPYMNLTVTGTNVVMGGQIIQTALSDTPGEPGSPCPSSSPSPAPTSSACTITTTTPTPGDTETPRVHPTQSASSSPCTS